MNTNDFIKSLVPGNYFITKSMELTKVQSSGTLWYIKKFLVLYYYIFLKDNILTLNVAQEICHIFDNFIESLPTNLQPAAKEFFYASEEVADLRSERFKLFNKFAGYSQFENDNAKNSYYESAKKYYFAFLMGSGGQSGVNSYIKNRLYDDDFSFDRIDGIVTEWAEDNINNPSHTHSSLQRYERGDVDGAISAMRNDYMAFIRNERQILFYYGFFHSKSNGANDREFSSLTPVGHLAVHSNFYELIAIWEHQKIKMLSQPVNIDIQGLESVNVNNADKFSVNLNPYLTILKSLKSTRGFSNDAYQYVISRLPQFPDDGINTDESFIDQVKEKVHSFYRKGDKNSEDFMKELKKYILGIRSDLNKDDGCNPFGLCKLDSRAGLQITNSEKLDRLVSIYNILSNYKSEKYNELFQECSDEIKRQYATKASGQPYAVDSRIKINWDMYNIHYDFLILLSVTVLLVEARIKTDFTNDSINDFIKYIRELCPNILLQLGLTSIASLKKELKSLLTVFQDGQYGMYLVDNSEEYGASVQTYLTESLADLLQQIKDKSSSESVYFEGVRKRNMALIGTIKSYNIKRFGGNMLNCECCGKPTFITFRNESYVEYHHLIPFSEYDGPDHYLNILALCPMCHRKLHFIKHEDKQALYNSIAKNSYNHLSIEDRLKRLHKEHKLTSYQLEFMLADKAIDESAYNRILQIA